MTQIWKPISWGECDNCGCCAEVFTDLEGEKAWDGDSVRCEECSMKGHVSINEDGSAWVNWDWESLPSEKSE
jgi:hypothetical protein